MRTATACAVLLAIFVGLASADTDFAETYSEHLKAIFDRSYRNNSKNLYFEWEGYDGWYNNPTHPDWGGADMPLERKAPVAYPNGVYEFTGIDRPNVLLIQNITQNGLTGFGSRERTALFIFFGQQVLDEMLDAQTPGCTPDYKNMEVPKCYDRDCRADRCIPFLHSHYDFDTGYSPNVSKMQLKEITPWLDGGLMYGVTKAWADTLRRFKGGELLSHDNSLPLSEQFPAVNTISLPLVNPPPPANHSLFEVNHFWRIGNPHGDENPFLLTMGILWYRVHNYWAKQLQKYGESENLGGVYEEDDWLYNRARQLTIATHQQLVYNEWLPIFIPRKFPNGRLIDYNNNPGYSAYSGYNPAINPQIAHIFQSVAMRFRHTGVTPGVWRRMLVEGAPNTCRFGSPISFKMEGLNAYIKVINEKLNSTEPNYKINSVTDAIDQFYTPYEDGMTPFPRDMNGNVIQEVEAIFNIINRTIYTKVAGYEASRYNYTDADSGHFVVRTCNSFWNPQVPVCDTNVHPFYLGMASQRVEREDTIITPDLRGQVFGPLDFSHHDVLAINMQRARDHGLPDFNSARMAYGLDPVTQFEGLNPLYGVVEEVTRSIENLRKVYNNDISKCDMWACGLAETVPFDFSDLVGVPAGPGELFSEVVFDQFMRIRHGDRFWYENYEANGILSQHEFQTIQNLTIKKVLQLITPIRDEDISDDPFRFTERTVCPQPFQLSEFYMDDCIALETFDYSVWQFPLFWGMMIMGGMIIGLVIMILIYKLDIIAIPKGQPKDKIELMFDMYDLNKSGNLSRDEFKKMLKDMKELFNASVTPEQMDQLIDSMFTVAGFQNKEELTLEDFNILLHDHKKEISSAHLNVPRAKQKEQPHISCRIQELTVSSAENFPSRMIAVYFKRPPNFDFKPGQWVMVANNAQNLGEFRPFTISSAPHEDYLSLHIIAKGDWTSNFRDHFNPESRHGQPYPKVFIDGPFGEHYQEWTQCEVSVLVGGGIGVTPFASIFKELVHRFKNGSPVECKKVFFIWVTPIEKQWKWFIDIIRDVENTDTKGLVEHRIHITQKSYHYMQYICEKHFQKLFHHSPFTGLRANTHFGRPDFKQFFDGLPEEYKQLPKIGVFPCGPCKMIKDVKDASAGTNCIVRPWDT